MTSISILLFGCTMYLLLESQETPNSKSCLDAASNWNWKGAGRGSGRGGLGVSQGEATHAAVPLSSMLPAAVPLPAREGPPQAVVPLQDR
jgi:hypothetical protein